MRSLACTVAFLYLLRVALGHSHTDICDPANYTASSVDLPLPDLSAQFSVVIEANIGQQNRTIYVKEYFDEVGNRGRFETTVNGMQVVGIFDYDDGEIFLLPDPTTGDACTVKQFTDPSTRRLSRTPALFGFQVLNETVHIGTVRGFFLGQREPNGTTYMGVEDVRGIPCNRWQTCTVMVNNSYTLDYYIATDDWEFARGDGPTPIQITLTARRGDEERNHIYSFMSFNTGPSSVPDEVFRVPLGLVCTGRSPGPPAPPLPPYFSATLEVVQPPLRSSVVFKVSHFIVQ